MPVSIVRKLLGLALLSLLSFSTLAQTEDQQHETIKIKTDLVALDALVTDKKTREVIRNLTLQDFELFEDDAKQQIEHFSQDKLPLSVVLLLDISPSVHPVIEEVRKGALRTLEHLKPEDEVALMVFAGATELIQDFTKDRKLIADKVGLALTRDGHGTRIHEAIGKAARQLKSATIPTSRRVVIVITDNQGSMKRKYDGVSEAEVKDAVIESGAAVCGVIVRSFLNVLDGILFQHPMMQEQFKRTSVNPHAELTGGEMTAANKETINARLGEMIDRLRNRYTLAYAPSNQDFNGKFRRIRLSLTPEAKKRLGRDVVIRAKQGYYAIDKETQALLAEASEELAESAATQPKADPPPATNGDAKVAAPDAPDATDAKVAASPDPASAKPIEATSTAASRPRRVNLESANPFANLVMLDVLAVNKKTGAMVKTLGKDDFEIEDRGAKQPISYFSRGEAPLSVVLLVDVTGNTMYALSSLRRSVKQWMGKLNPDDEVALMAFGAGAVVMQDFTTDRKLITLKLRNFAEDARKQNLGAYQVRSSAVFQAAEYVEKAANPLSRRVIVVITDDTKSLYEGGKPELVAERVLGSGCSVYALVANGYRARKGKITRVIVESALYSFGNPVSFAINLGGRIVSEAAVNAITNDRSFGRIVARSGGSASRADGDTTADKLTLLLDHMRSRYVIGFAPPQHTTGDRFHKLNLKLTPQAQKREGEVVVGAAQGYFARKNDPSGLQSEIDAEKK
jgi:VWFA-related protein